MATTSTVIPCYFFTEPNSALKITTKDTAEIKRQVIKQILDLYKKDTRTSLEIIFIEESQGKLVTLMLKFEYRQNRVTFPITIHTQQLIDAFESLKKQRALPDFPIKIDGIGYALVDNESQLVESENFRIELSHNNEYLKDLISIRMVWNNLIAGEASAIISANALTKALKLSLDKNNIKHN